jgi:4-hydroxybenzoate polyprenyltransferase
VSNRWAASLPLLARACHLEPTLAVTALTALLAADAGHPASTGVLVTSAVFTGQLSIGWSNDLIDANRDRSVRRADKPLADGRLDPRLVTGALLVAVPVCVVLSLLCGLSSGLTHLVLGVGSGWVYNLGVKATAWSWAPYLVAFGSLPAVVWLALPASEVPPWWLLAAAALLGVAAHIVNTLPDLADDEATGVKGLPHRLGNRRSRLLASAILAVASLTVVLGPGGSPPLWAWAGLALVVVLTAVAQTRRDRTAFHATIAIAFVDVVMLLAR